MNSRDYKDAEGLVRALAEKFNLSIISRRRRRKVVHSDMTNAAARLSQRHGNQVRAGWDSVYILHV